MTERVFHVVGLLRRRRATAATCVRVVASRAADVGAGRGPALAADEPRERWQTTLAALTAARVHIEVDAAVAHLFAVPWQAPIARVSDWNSLAAARHQHLFGGESQAWSIRLDDAMPPATRLAVALPSELLNAVRSGLGARLAGVRVDVVERLRRWCAAHRRYSGLVVAVDSAGAWLFVYRSGALQRVRRRRLDVAAMTVAEMSSSDGVVRALAPVVLSEWAAVPGESAETAGPPHLAITASAVPATFGPALAAAVGARCEAMA